MLWKIWFPALIGMVFILSQPVSSCATVYRVDATKLYIYAQSQSDKAHLIRSSVGIYQGGEHPLCGNRAYIDSADKELFATALAASLTNKTVYFYYEDNAESKVITGHTTSKCRVFSIWTN